MCKDFAQILHFSELAIAGKVASPFITVAGFADGDPALKGGIVRLLPFLGNLALKQAYVACLDGSKSEIRFNQPINLTKLHWKQGSRTSP